MSAPPADRPDDSPPTDRHLRAALRHAPDADVAPPPALSSRILGEARAAVAPSRRWRWPTFAMPWAGGFAALLVAVGVGLLWWDEPLPPPGADAPIAATEQAAVRTDSVAKTPAPTAEPAPSADTAAAEGTTPPAPAPAAPAPAAPAPAAPAPAAPAPAPAARPAPAVPATPAAPTTPRPQAAQIDLAKRAPAQLGAAGDSRRVPAAPAEAARAEAAEADRAANAQAEPPAERREAFAGERARAAAQLSRLQAAPAAVPALPDAMADAAGRAWLQRLLELGSQRWQLQRDGALPAGPQRHWPDAGVTVASSGTGWAWRDQASGRVWTLALSPDELTALGEPDR